MRGRLNSRIEGAAFTAELRLTRLKFWLQVEGKRRSVKTSNVQSAIIQPNGYTKITVRYGKDLTIPTSSHESVQLVRAVNALISEIAAVELRNRQAATQKSAYYKQARHRGTLVPGRRR